MLSGRAAAWAPAKCEEEEERGADPGAPRLCGHVDRLAAEPGALQPLCAAPTPAPYPELVPGGHLCKPQQVLLAVDFLPPLAELHPHGPPCGMPSAHWHSLHHRGQSSAPRPKQGLPETSRGPARTPGASTLLEQPVDSAVNFGALSQGCKQPSC